MSEQTYLSETTLSMSTDSGCFDSPERTISILRSQLDTIHAENSRLKADYATLHERHDRMCRAMQHISEAFLLYLQAREIP